jgi:hypothetical protein
MNDDLFRAVLAMDSYNRGYNMGVNGLGGIGAQIGNATISVQSDTAAGSPGVTASFYAVAYTWNNHQIIANRGTDNFSGDVAAWIGASSTH